METRRDALVAASHLIKAVQQIGLDQPLTGRATVGHMVVTPNSPNVIPGHVELMVEFRNPEVPVLDVMTASLNQALKETADKYGVELASRSLIPQPSTSHRNLLTWLSKRLPLVARPQSA
jgi:N-carbamoyl-L-amino-acid hydrolase